MSDLFRALDKLDAAEHRLREAEQARDAALADNRRLREKDMNNFRREIIGSCSQCGAGLAYGHYVHCPLYEPPDMSGVIEAVKGMTIGEDLKSTRLHAKSDIAAELAWRDAEIARLREALRICVYEVGLADEDGAATAEDIARATLENTDG